MNQITKSNIKMENTYTKIEIRNGVSIYRLDPAGVKITDLIDGEIVNKLQELTLTLEEGESLPIGEYLMNKENIIDLLNDFNVDRDYYLEHPELSEEYKISVEILENQLKTLL